MFDFIGFAGAVLGFFVIVSIVVAMLLAAVVSPFYALFWMIFQLWGC